MTTMTEVEQLDSKYDGLDVESILARQEKRSPLSFSRNRCLYQAPEFIQRLPAEETVQEGTTVSFGCKIVGFPKPAITWYKDENVIGPEARAQTDTIDNGIYCVKIQEVSKCDAGTYKVRATNLEGSSTSSLYLCVKAKAKSRTRKKKKSRAVMCAPAFPAIVEHEAEERRETLAVAQLPESPLTPLYSNISRRSPVMWPEFLGEWAYNMEEGVSKDEIDCDDTCEDVFDNEDVHTTSDTTSGDLTSSSGDLTSVNTGHTTHAQSNSDVSCNSENVNHKVKLSQRPTNLNYAPSANYNQDLVLVSQNKLIPDAYDDTRQKEHDETGLTLDLNGILNKRSTNAIITNTSASESNINKASAFVEVLPVEPKDKHVLFDPNTVSKISVNRSYARGNSTFSVATRRSPSPFTRDQNHVINNKLQNSSVHENLDTSTLQNLSNERLLQRMRQAGSQGSSQIYKLLSRDFGIEIILLLCGSTFLALCFDISPSSFMLDILIALLVKFVLTFILKDR